MIIIERDENGMISALTEEQSKRYSLYEITPIGTQFKIFIDLDTDEVIDSEENYNRRND